MVSTRNMMMYVVFPTLIATALCAAFPAVTENNPRDSQAALNLSSYAPAVIQCPTRNQWVRPAIGLSDEETLWVEGRKRKVLDGLSAYLRRLHLHDFDLDEYLHRLGSNITNVPTIGLEISGGAWASALTGAGFLQALDDRFEDSVKERTGGLLQSTTYISGLSGGSFTVMSLVTYDFPTVAQMVSDWHVDQFPVDAPKNTAHRATTKTIFEQVYEKFKAGFDVSFTDFLGRAVAYEFVAGPEGGIATTLSSITQLDNFKNYEMPLPIWQAAQGMSTDVEELGIKVPYFNTTLFEWSPFEFGAWDGPSAFFPSEYLGTKMANGAPVSQRDCIVGFDRVSYMIAVAGDAWNFWWLSALTNGTLGTFTKRSEGPSIQPRANSFPVATLKELAAGFLKVFNTTRDEALYATVPNPFATNASVNNRASPPQNLTLVDESEAGQALPLWSQVQPARNVDFIIAWEDSEEAVPYYWNNGANLHQTYVYATNRSVPFPIVPPAATFINRNYTFKPTLFGCDANLTNTYDLQAPIILYVPNAPYSSYTNYSAFQTNFTREEMAVILTNGFNLMTQGNGTLDSEWSECLGCAAIDRSLSRVGMQRTEQCQTCMSRHCWDGIEDNSGPDVTDIPLVLDPSLSFDEWNKSSPQTGLFWGEVSK